MNEIDYEQEHPRDLIKCVLVGDTGVGKTRLICAEALGSGISHPLSINSHVHYPTVFAIDQYHVSEEIRERANFIVDGVEVSLRLWDTFGEHEFNRKFAYQNAHVVLLCFSVNSLASFKNVTAMWYPEIRKCCPRVPILLVGTQSDRRYHSLPCVTKSYKNLSSLSKCMQECTLVTPDMGRQVAEEIGATYYEESVVTMFGVKEVFENAVRAALVHRRRTRFLRSQLKRVSRPQLQQPYLPNKPDAPKITCGPASMYHDNLKALLDGALYADVEFSVEGHYCYAHRVVLCAASPVFAQLFQAKGLADYEDHSCFLFNMASSTQHLIVLQDALVLGSPAKLPKGFESIEEKQWDNHKVLVIDVDNCISHDMFSHILEFLYTGSLSVEACTRKLLDSARHLQLCNLSAYVVNTVNDADYMNSQVYHHMTRRMVSCTHKLVGNKYLSDVLFDVGGMPIYAHKAFLVSQCEMLSAMFMEGHFKESGRHMVELKDTNHGCFMSVLEFLYTGQWPSQSVENPVELLALANFFCLPRLVALCEQHIIKEIQVATATDELAVADDIIVYLTEAQLHNACQLQEWCLHYLTTHYNHVCRSFPKELKSLSLSTRKHLEKHRWPPMWYLMEADWFDRTKRKQDEERLARMHKSHKHTGRKKKCHCL